MSIKETIKRYTSECWNIGFILNSLDGIFNGEDIRVEWMRHACKKSWFADPFILDVTSTEIWVLVEEFYKPIQKGRISRLIVDRETYQLKRLDVVLELPTHLSFPAIIRNEEGIFIYPENGESGELNAYRYFPDTNACEKVETILHESVADAVVAQIDGRKWLFCTQQPDPNGNTLFVYKKEEKGTFKPAGEYVFDEKVARMAGDFFEYKEKVYRPTQECNIQYGHAVTLQEVTHNNGKFEFKEVRRMHSVHPTLTVGMHTFNMYKGLIVTDALGFHNMWIRKTLKFLGVLN